MSHRKKHILSLLLFAIPGCSVAPSFDDQYRQFIACRDSGRYYEAYLLVDRVMKDPSKDVEGARVLDFIKLNTAAAANGSYDWIRIFGDPDIAYDDKQALLYQIDDQSHLNASLRSEKKR